MGDHRRQSVQPSCWPATAWCASSRCSRRSPACSASRSPRSSPRAPARPAAISCSASSPASPTARAVSPSRSWCAVPSSGCCGSSSTRHLMPRANSRGRGSAVRLLLRGYLLATLGGDGGLPRPWLRAVDALRAGRHRLAGVRADRHGLPAVHRCGRCSVSGSSAGPAASSRQQTRRRDPARHAPQAQTAWRMAGSDSGSATNSSSSPGSSGSSGVGAMTREPRTIVDQCRILRAERGVAPGGRRTARPRAGSPRPDWPGPRGS